MTPLPLRRPVYAGPDVASLAMPEHIYTRRGLPARAPSVGTKSLLPSVRSCPGPLSQDKDHRPCSASCCSSPASSPRLSLLSISRRCRYAAIQLSQIASDAATDKPLRLQERVRGAVAAATPAPGHGFGHARTERYPGIRALKSIRNS